MKYEDVNTTQSAFQPGGSFDFCFWSCLLRPAILPLGLQSMQVLKLENQ